MLLWSCRDMLCPDDPSVCFLSFPLIRRTEIKENDRYMGERKEGEKGGEAVGSNLKRLAERISSTSSRHSSPRCWQRKGVNDITCTCLTQMGWQVRKPQARILVDLWTMK